MIKGGRISVNGSIITDLALSVGAGDEVRLDNKTTEPQKKIVLALNKPVGFLSTTKDDFMRKTVLHLIGNTGKRLYPAGRLDKGSRGLIILTNDGDLVYRITHPSFNISKTYEVSLERTIQDRDVNKIKMGVLIDKRVFLPEFLKKTQKSQDGFPIVIKIHEGRKRIIRRVFKKMGYNVTDLKRIRIGDYSLADIPEGEYRKVDENGIRKLLMMR